MIIGSLLDAALPRLALSVRQPTVIIPCGGQLDFFEWTPGGAAEQPLRWMLKDAAQPSEPLAPEQGALL